MYMKLLRNYDFKWWQVSLLKIAMVGAGIIIGVLCVDFFSQYLREVIIIVAALTAYFWYLMIRGKI